MPISNSREFVVKVGHVLLLLLLMLLLVPQRQALDIPPHRNNFFQKNPHDIHKHSFILAKEIESEKYLFKGVPRNFTFTISKGRSFSITVTPCASPITWTLYVRPEKKGFRGIGRQRHSLTSIQQLDQFTGENRTTSHQMNAQAGAYILGVTSLETDSYVKIFLTTNPGLNPTYPVVPSDSRVNVQSFKRTLIIDWPSGALVNKPSRSVEYCVTISRLKNFQSHCSALAHLHGDKKPKFDYFGFKGQKQKNREQRRMASPIKRAPSRMIFHQCVANKTSFTFTRVKRGKTYFVDVFVIDKNSNAASAYTGAWVKVKRRKRSPKVRMGVGDIKTINLKRKSIVQLKLDKKVPRLAFELIPCGGKIPFELYHNGKKIKSKTMVRRWKRHFIKDAMPGTYLMTFPGKKKRKKKKKTFVTVSITSTPSRSKVNLPKKSKMKVVVFDKLTTCSEVTMAWMGTSVDQTYCVYKKKLRKNGRDSRRQRCLNSFLRPSKDQLSCTTFSATDASRQTLTYNVTGLEPNTWYRLDVFVTRGRSASVPYRRARVKTLAQCPR